MINGFRDRRPAVRRFPNAHSWLENGFSSDEECTSADLGCQTQVVNVDSSSMNADLKARLLEVNAVLRKYYGARYQSLIAMPQQQAGQLELLLVLRDSIVNQMRELLRVEPVALRFSTLELELSILPVSQGAFDAALEPSLWEAKFVGVVID